MSFKEVTNSKIPFKIPTKVAVFATDAAVTMRLRRIG